MDEKRVNTDMQIKEQEGQEAPACEDKPRVRKITIKTAVRAAAQGHNRYAGPTPT